MQSLPSFSDVGAYDAWRTDASRWLPAAAGIARAHALPAPSHAFARGTNLVAALGDALILKIYPPLLRHQFVSERAALTLLAGRLSIAIPQIVAESERDGWPYLVITRLTGTVANEIWPDLSEAEKERVIGRLGAVIAQVQRVPVGALSALEPRWEDFIPRQIAGCRARHERLGLPRHFLDGLDDFLRDAASLIPLNPQVILTGEYVPENLVLSREPDGWHLAGLIDFGDVMTGFGEYDLLGPSVFMTAGIPARVAALLRGYGYGDADLTLALRRRLMLLMLLHRFSDPVRHIQIENWQQKAGNLAELERLIWPIDG
jgi:hygromycin-B 7''-O-kinase